MPGKLLIIEGPSSGGELSLEEGESWTLGRDPDQSQLIIEDPAISRLHLRLRAEQGGIVVENASDTNPALLNGKELTESTLLEEGDLLQLGHTTLKFTLSEVPTFQTVWEGPPTEMPASPSDLAIPARFVLKVVTGPNAGAEFPLEKGRSYLLGTDAEACDILFFDLSISAQHCRISVTDDEKLEIEDLKSRNGVLIEGVRIEERAYFEPNAMVALGTTTFFVLDREASRETIVAPALRPAEAAREETPAMAAAAAAQEGIQIGGFKIPPVPLAGALLGLLLFAGAIWIGSRAVEGLFQSHPVAERVAMCPDTVLQAALMGYPEVSYLYNPNTGRLFMLGHVLTPLDLANLLYCVRQIPQVLSIDSHVVVDEQVWREMNQVLANEGRWPGVSMHAPRPGLFVVTGYVNNEQQAAQLLAFLTLNFDHMDRLQDQVVVEQDLAARVTVMLINANFQSLSGSLVDGELTLTGVVGTDQWDTLERLVKELDQLAGIRQVNNYVVRVAPSATAQDLGSQYPVQGSSHNHDHAVAVVIKGRILTVGDMLDGMVVSEITPDTVWLTKDMQKFKINYNSQ